VTSVVAFVISLEIERLPTSAVVAVTQATAGAALVLGKSLVAGRHKKENSQDAR
jgi:hypothetical protein